MCVLIVHIAILPENRTCYAVLALILGSRQCVTIQKSGIDILMAKKLLRFFYLAAPQHIQRCGRVSEAVRGDPVALKPYGYKVTLCDPAHRARC